MTEPRETPPSSAEMNRSAISDQSVNADQVRQVAALANLELREDELASMQRDLNAVLGYVAQLSELEVTTIPPMAQVFEVLPGEGSADHARTHGASSSLRADVPVPGVLREPVMAAAPETDGVFFKVPRVIER